jgi:phosphonate transport system substrate-binding protein
MRYRIFGVLSVVWIFNSGAQAACLGNQGAEKVLTVAVVPQLTLTDTYSKWSPLLEQVGLISGQCFDLQIPKTIPAFEALLLKGVPDFAFLNPYHAVMAKRRMGYIPLLIDGQTKLTGILVVRIDSPIHRIQDLQGKEIAFPAPNSFAASLLIRAELEKKGIQIYPKYLKTHSGSYRAVALGEVVAAGGVNNTLQREEQALREKLRVLYETSGYASHPFVANPRVPLIIRRSVTEAFISLSKDPRGEKLLEGVQIPAPIPSDYQRDFAPLERLKLDKFVVLDGG